MPSERFSKDDGCEDSRDLDGEDPGESAEAVPRLVIIRNASVHTLPLNSDSPEKAASNRPESLEASPKPQTTEADGNVHSDERALHDYLEQYATSINELIKDIDKVPHVLPPSDRETVRGILHQAHNCEKEQLVVKHGPAAVASEDQIFQQYLEGVTKRLVNKHSNHHGLSGPSPASPASYTSSSSDITFTRSGKSLRSMNSASSEIRTYSFTGWESDLEEKRRKTATMQQVSITPAVHDLPKSEWRLPVRSKISSRLREWLKSIISGTVIFILPVITEEENQTQDRDSTTQYSITIILPEIKEIRSRSFKSVSISPPENFKHLVHVSQDNGNHQLKVCSFALAFTDRFNLNS